MNKLELTPEQLQALQIVLEAAEVRQEQWQAFAAVEDSWAVDSSELLAEMYDSSWQESEAIAERYGQAIKTLRESMK